MKKSLLSIFLAGVLFFSNIEMTSFAVEREQDASGADVSSQEDGEKENEKALDISEEEEISYYKITDFTALPENISQQKVRIGASLDDIDFPDTLEVKVEPDLDREDRIMRKLAQERERIRKEKELEEAEAASSASSDEADEAASEGSSFGEEEEEIIIFDDGEQIDDASELSQEEERKEESTDKETGNDAPATDSTIAPSEPVSSTEESTLPVETGEEITEEQDDEKEPGSEDENIGNEGDGAENSSDQGNSMEIPGAENTAENGLIGRILDAFRSVRVYAADDSNEDKEESKDDLDISENEKTKQTSEPSIERISGIEWVLEAQYNDGVDFFSPDQDGQIYLFTPVLLIPDNYYIEDELPIITVIVSDEYFSFDEAVEVDGVTIRVRADKGVFPEGATVSVRKLATEDQEKVQAAFDEQVEVDTESIVKEYTFDITVLDRDGNEVEPDTDKGRVFVSFETEEVADESLSAEVYHFVESIDENTEAEAKENEAGDIEIGAEVEFDVGESELGGERGDIIFDDDVVLFVEKLEPEVVEVDEGQAIEVETFGFSTYRVVFTTGETTYEYNLEDSALVSVRKVLAKVINNSDSESGFTGNINGVVNKNKDEGYYVTPIRLSTTTADTTSGCYSIDTESGNWYFLVKRPFKVDKIALEVNYSNSNSSQPQTVTINIVNDNAIDGSTVLNNNYPNAVELTNSGFKLELPNLPAEKASTPTVILFQWQRSADGKKWEDISGANQEYFGESKDFADKTNYWYRCCMNGVDSNPVQIITEATDDREWTQYYGDGKQCYVSNGAIAYSKIGTNLFDIVGEFNANGSKYMAHSSNAGQGWTFFNDTSATATNTDVYSGLKDIMFSFNDSDNRLLHIDASLKDTHKFFALSANAQIGNSIKDTSIASIDNNKLKYIALLGIDKQENAQIKINEGRGDEIPTLKIIPKTATGLNYYIGSTSATTNPYNNCEETLVENTIPRTSVSWHNISGDVEFDFRFAGAESNEVLKKYEKKATYSYSGSSTKIKNVKPTGNELTSFAQSLGTSTENVLVNMQLKSTSSGTSAISSKIKSYGTTNASNSNTNSSSNSSTKTTNVYSADYMDVTVKQTINTTTTNVDEIKKDSQPLPIRLEISYDFTDINDIKVLREHDGSITEFSNSSSGGDGTYQVDRNAGKIYVYTNKFSMFAVAYKPITYYTVSFYIDKNTINKVQVKSGNQLAVPENPVKDGYTFLAWSTSSDSKKYKDYIYDFSKQVTSNFTLYAVFQENNASSEEEGDVNGSRAPGTNDSLPVVWLWVLVLIAGVSSFGYAFYERFKAKGGETKAGAKMSKLKRMILLVGIVVSTVVKFLIKKLKQHKYECMLAASAVLILISVGTLVSTMLEYRKSEEIYIDVNDEYVDEPGADVQEMADREDLAESAQNEEKNWWNDVNVDVAGLSAEYPDVVGWIYFENEDISYPIMYSGDNSKYLGTAYTGQKAKAGAIFIDGESTPDFSDPHSLIYGHNMRDLSMFGRLKFYKTDASYYDEHQYFQVFTKDGVYRYQIFAYEEVPDSHDVFWVYGQEPEGMDTMLKEIEQGSYRKTGVNPTEGDHIITLATCTSKEDRRLIVSAVRTDEHNF